MTQKKEVMKMTVRFSNRIKFGVTLFLFFLLAFFCQTQDASAQGYMNFGTNPPISPWVALGNRPTGSLDSYNQYVRPRLEMQSMMGAQQTQLNRQGMQQQMMMRSSQGVGSGMGMQQGGGAPTVGRFKPAATFRNYSHYYPNMR